MEAPLIVARKGLYTALAKWARGKGYAELSVDGKLLPTAKWPRLDRFVEHDIELPVATIGVSAARESELRQALATALEHGRGVVRVSIAGTDDSAVFSTKRACPRCGTGFPELDPRLFSFNSRHGWCKSCFGTGLAIDGLRRRAKRRGIEMARRRDRRGLPGDCAGERLNPVARNVLFRGLSIAALTHLPVDDFADGCPA